MRAGGRECLLGRLKYGLCEARRGNIMEEFFAVPKNTASINGDRRVQGRGWREEGGSGGKEIVEEQHMDLPLEPIDAVTVRTACIP